jgi:hypothetical protein
VRGLAQLAQALENAAKAKVKGTATATTQSGQLAFGRWFVSGYISPQNNGVSPASRHVHKKPGR